MAEDNIELLEKPVLSETNINEVIMSRYLLDMLEYLRKNKTIHSCSFYNNEFATMDSAVKNAPMNLNTGKTTCYLEFNSSDFKADRDGYFVEAEFRFTLYIAGLKLSNNLDRGLVAFSDTCWNTMQSVLEQFQKDVVNKDAIGRPDPVSSDNSFVSEKGSVKYNLSRLFFSQKVMLYRIKYGR